MPQAWATRDKRARFLVIDRTLKLLPMLLFSEISPLSDWGKRVLLKAALPVQDAEGKGPKARSKGIPIIAGHLTILILLS